MQLQKKSLGLLRLSMFILSVFFVAFQLFATPALAAQATLTWSAPTTYTDGTPVTSLSGYMIHTGTASGNYSQSINVGNVASYTLTGLNDASTYYFALMAVDSKGVSSRFSNELSFTTPTPSPSLPTYTLTASAGTGGSISPTGSLAISQGLSQSYSITPAIGYNIAGVTVDGVAKGALTTYTFSNVTASHTITASFTPATGTVTSYTISATAGTGGTVSPAGTTTVSSGTSKTFTITPSTGYRIADVKVNGVSVGAVASYTFSNVTANKTLAASFSPVLVVVSAINSGGSQLIDSTKAVYSTDAKYSGGNAAKTTSAISGTVDDVLYQSERYGNFSYNIPVANGNYSITLKFAEIYWTAAGKRVFSVNINGQTVISNLDIYAKVGKNVAYDVVIPVSVTTGALNIKFVSQTNYAKVSAILVKTR